MEQYTYDSHGNDRHFWFDDDNKMSYPIILQWKQKGHRELTTS